MANENLGPAERIIQTLLAYADHVVHNRPGVVLPDPSSAVGTRWVYAKRKKAEAGTDERVVVELRKSGKKTVEVRLGTVSPGSNVVRNGAVQVGEYRRPGFFVETAVWMYKQIAEVWKLDNEFAGHWASYAFGQEHRDLKVLLAAFMLVQSRHGAPVLENGKLAFYDEDLREVGEAMFLLDKEKGGFSVKLLLRVRELLSLPEIAKINHELGFGRSARRPELGRWQKAAVRWLRFRERNPKMLEGLVKSGARWSVISLARQTRYVPMGEGFYRTLRWKQTQSGDGRRTRGLGLLIEKADTWEGLTEEEVCGRIARDKPKWNRLSAMLPQGVGLTRAVMGAAIESGCISDAELIILAPTLEELGLLEIQAYRERYERALRGPENMRAANIAARMKSKENREALETAADAALQKQVAEVIKGLVLYFIVDISGSMSVSIATAMQYLPRFLQGFPLEKMAVAVFSTSARLIEIKHASKAGVENAFRGITAGGGTDHASGVRMVTSRLKPAPDEDAVLVVIGDGGEHGGDRLARAILASGVVPGALGFLELPGDNFGAPRLAAAQLGIPCFDIDERIFGSVATGGVVDPYAIPRAIRTLIAATPVGKGAVNGTRKRETLVDTILKTPLLRRPSWASVNA
jgi:hypothetical protein